jgi:DNA repair photolyase
MLNESKGNMYDFVTHTWNTVKGECPHGCSYCYMHRWGKQKPVRFDEKEFKTDLGTGNFIFVGSSCDMFAKDIPDEWILLTLNHCSHFDNKYLFQTKNPARILDYIDTPVIKEKSVVCTTIETNRWIPEVMKNSPQPYDRAYVMDELSARGLTTYVTIEPILDFDLPGLLNLIAVSRAKQVNIGADTGNNHLPEPPKEKILELISCLEKFTMVHQKSNLKRLLK